MKENVLDERDRLKVRVKFSPKSKWNLIRVLVMGDWNVNMLLGFASF